VFKKSFLFFSFAILSGCNSGDDGESSKLEESTVAPLACPSDQEGIVGCWVTESCVQFTDEDGKLIESSGNLNVQFSQEGSIKFLPQRFENASCAGEPDATKTGGDELEISYIMAEPALDESGIVADQLAVTITPDPDEEEPYGVETLYSISNNYRLCLSENFEVKGDSFSISQSQSRAIDFNSCLLRAE